MTTYKLPDDAAIRNAIFNAIDNYEVTGNRSDLATELLAMLAAAPAREAVVDEAMVRGWRNRFICAQTELNQRASGMEYEMARLHAEETANEYGAALTAALTHPQGDDDGR